MTWWCGTSIALLNIWTTGFIKLAVVICLDKVAGLSKETQIQLLSWLFSCQGQVMRPQGCTFLWLYWSSTLGQEGWIDWTSCCLLFPRSENQCESVDVSPWGCNIVPLLWTLQMDYCVFYCYIFIYVSISSLHPQLGPGIFFFYFLHEFMRVWGAVMPALL